MDTQGSPIMLKAEIVKDLGGEMMVVRRVSGSRTGGDEVGQSGGDWRVSSLGCGHDGLDEFK